MTPHIKLVVSACVVLIALARWTFADESKSDVLKVAPATESKTEGQENKFEKDIQAFEAKDKEHPPQPGQVVFVGSSSVRLWDLKKSFPKLEALNRGFGGSQTSDAAFYAQRIVTNYKPRLVVFYSGDNDIGSGKSPEQVAKDVQAFVAAVRAEMPDVPMILLSIKPSVKREKLFDKQQVANKLIHDFAAGQKNVTFIDVAPAMLTFEGKPRPEIFREDQLHMNDEGYKIWAGLLEKLVAPSPGVK